MKTKYLTSVKKYIKLHDELPDIIKESGLKDKFIYNQIGMDARTWTYRKNQKNWQPHELLNILQVIENQPLTKSPAPPSSFS